MGADNYSSATLRDLRLNQALRRFASTKRLKSQTFFVGSCSSRNSGLNAATHFDALFLTTVFITLP
jgi:hypothetical protein